LRLKDITSDLRKSEKEHFLKVQELHGEDVYKPKNKNDMENFLNDDESQMQVLEEEDESSYR
jgi:hypothetical protein